MKNIHPLKFILISTFIFICLACCMLPKSYKGSIEQTQQEGIIIYDQGVQDLILKVDPKISGKEKLDSFCWLITVPNEPDKYDTCDASIFEEMYNLKLRYLVIPRDNRSMGCSEKSESKSKDSVKALPDGVELGEFVKVGDYNIQPVRGVGKNALSGLNKWLEMNGFPTESEDHMKYFVDNKFTFLCIKVNSEQGSEIGSRPELKPLHLTFKSDKVYYPMKYSSQQGDFSANIYTITSMPVDYIKSDEVLKRLSFKNHNLYKNVNLADKELPQGLKALVDEKKPYLYMNSFFCSHPNYDKAISKWTEDIFFSLNNSHWPNAANQMKGRIDWFRTAFLILALLAVAVIAKRKWSKSYSS